MALKSSFLTKISNNVIIGTFLALFLIILDICKLKKEIFMKKNSLSIMASILLLGGTFSTIQAADLTASNPTAQVIFHDTDAGGTDAWAIQGNDNALLIRDSQSSVNPLYIFKSVKNDNSINIDATGTVNLAKKGVAISQSDTTVGVENAPTVKISNPNQVTFGGGSGSLDWLLNKDLNITDDYKNKTFNIAYDFSAIGTTTKIPFTIVGNANDNSVFMNENGIGILNGNPQASMDVNGDIKATFKGAGVENVYRLLTLSANDTDGTGPSEASFVLRNDKANQEWLFRTIDNGTAFTATLGGTGGPEFKVVSDQGDYTKTKLYIGGQLVFANGKIQAGVLP